MTNAASTAERRLLMVDHDQALSQRVREILSDGFVSDEPASSRHVQSQQFAPPHTPPPIHCEVDSAIDGNDAVRRVAEAVTHQRPYALALVNLPAGAAEQCVETIQRIWNADPKIQTILCIPPTERQVDSVIASLGISDRLLVLRRPYQEVELRLSAFALTQKWHLACQMAETREQGSDSMRDAQRVMEIIHECEQELVDSRDDLQIQATRLSDQLQERMDEILGTRNVMVFALERLAESRDAETGEHLERLRTYSQLLAEDLAVTGPYTQDINHEFLHNFALSTPLHDIGKVGVPDCILQKPGSLDIDEFDIMKQHTLIGAEALQAAARQSVYVEFLLMAADIARSHHERFDGAGYPDGLSGADIPLPARIVAVADVFDALTSRRVYKDEQAVEEARDIIISASGTHFDPHVVAAFERCYDAFLQVKSEHAALNTEANHAIEPAVTSD